MSIPFSACQARISCLSMTPYMTPTYRTVLAKHEQGAAFMAGGLAREAGGIGACITTAGPGATNLVTGIADAFMDSIPFPGIGGGF